MERDLEQMARVLRQVAHDAGCALLGRRDAEALRFCIDQYNRIRTRLGTIDTAYTTLFGRLPADAHPGDVRILARALSLYIREKLRREQGYAFPFAFRLDFCC